MSSPAKDGPAFMRNLRFAALAAFFALAAMRCPVGPVFCDPAAAVATPAAIAPAPPALPSWCLGPFVKELGVNPVIAPNPASKFLDPMTGKQVAWEQDNTFNPAAAVRNGEVCVLYRAEDDSGEGIGHHTSRLGLATSKDGLHFTQSAGLVAIHPIADVLSHEFPFFAWLLRGTAFNRFGYDPDGVFGTKPTPYGFASGIDVEVMARAPIQGATP